MSVITTPITVIPQGDRYDRDSGKFPWIPLIALAAAVFLCITSEMIPTGLMPLMSSDLGVSESRIGLLVTLFAAAVVVTSVPLTMATKRVPRHLLVVALILVLAISNVLTAIAPSYEWVVVARILGGMAHGVFWGTVGPYSARLVSAPQLGRAISITGGGGSLAMIMGIPLGTAAGAVIGWRTTFLVLAGLMVIGAIVIWRLLPPVSRPELAARRAAKAGRAGKPRDASLLPVILFCLLTGILMTGVYTLYSYIAPYLLTVMGVDEAGLALMLASYGIAGAVGLVLVGTVFTARAQTGLIISIVASGITVAAFAFSAGLPWLMVPSFFLWGIAVGCVPSLMQTRVLQIASPELRDNTGAFLTMGFNIGIGGGALLGGIVFDLAGPEWLPAVNGAIVVIGVALAIWANAASKGLPLAK